MRIVQRLCVALFLVIGIQAASAFALLGPFAPWMVAPLTYRLPDAIGGPMKMDEGYRWNVPVITYGYDQSFLNYFGSNGVAAVDSAVQILNALPPSSQIVLTNYPFANSRANPLAQSQGLLDLKSAALVQLVEQMGLAQPIKSIFSLRNFSYDPSNYYYANYTVEMRNYDPVTLAPTTVVNSALFGYDVYFSLPPHSFVYAGGYSHAFSTQGVPVPAGYATTQEYIIDPRTAANQAVAEYEPSAFDGSALSAMPFRNSGINGAHGIFDWSAAAGVFAQAGPTADRLAQRSRTGSLPAFGDGHICNVPQRAANHEA